VDALIDLEPARRGAHLSRNIEALADAVVECRSASSIEELLEGVARRLLDRHPYATRAYVRARTTYYVDLELPEEGLRGVEPVDVEVSVSRSRDGGGERRVSVAIAGMSVCPSAATTTSQILGTPRESSPSHAQRVIVRGSITSRGGMARIEDVARILSRAPSAPAYTLLKREQEARLVIHAFKNQKFAEDIARDALCGLAGLASRCCPKALVEVEVESLESIHPHNVYVKKMLDASEALRVCGLG